MELINKQSEIHVTKPASRMERRIVWIVFGLVEMMLAFRLVFKMLGANQNNGFVHGLYAGTQYIVGTFENIVFSIQDTGVRDDHHLRAGDFDFNGHGCVDCLVVF